MNMQSIMAQAQKMQRDITNKKEEINKTIFEGTSELVNIKINGKKEIVNVEILTDKIDNDEIEILQDMILLAFNSAAKKVDEETNKQLGQYGSSLNGLI